jgi:hypothetical protein
MPAWLSQAVAELSWAKGALWAVESFALYCFATVGFDVIHWLLHACWRSANPLLKAVGGLHHVHHQFLGPSLRHDDRFILRNFIQHRMGEFANQVLFTAAAFAVLPPAPVVLTLIIFTVQFVACTAQRGKDSHHQELAVVKAPLSGVFVDANYHALHHIHPDQYFSSVVTVFDKLFGTGCQVAGRKVVMTGAHGAFGAPLKAILEGQGATVTGLTFGVDYGYGDYGRARAALREADILVLAHGSKVKDAMAANCDSFVELIELFREETRERRFPPEVWAVGSEIEAHPAWGNPELQIYLESKRAFARHARRYFHEPSLLYRHIVPSAFTSPMGKGLISGTTAARWAWFLIRRGYRYVPVSYSGIALLNYVKFVLRLHALPDPHPDRNRVRLLAAPRA